MNESRRSWGEEPYRPDMDWTMCKQSELTDEYGTIEEIFNAVCYFDVRLDREPIHNSIHLLVNCQRGMSDKKLELWNIPKKLDDHHGMRKPADPQEIANMVHHYLDWLRACNKRDWDSRPLNPSRDMLDACVKGHYVDKHNELHYDEPKERNG